MLIVYEPVVGMTFVVFTMVTVLLVWPYIVLTMCQHFETGRYLDAVNYVLCRQFLFYIVKYLLTHFLYINLHFN